MNKYKIKYFMPEEANRALSLVRQIVRDILYNKFQISTIITSLGGNNEAILQNDEIQKFSKEINHFIDELEEIGCYYRDFKTSVCLVDFRAMIEGEEVFLCWRSNENSVTYYHGLNDGYKMRKPIPEYYFQNAYERT